MSKSILTPREKKRLRRKLYYQRNPEKRRQEKRNQYYRKNYGITHAEAQEMKKSGCAVCFTTDEPLHIDHCHVTFHVRGILCSSCNTALGSAKENQTRLENLAKYVANVCDPMKELFANGPCAKIPFKKGKNHFGKNCLHS